MSLLHAFVLGLIQGITEFLPISSSGHLIFLPKFFDWPDQGIEFDAVLNVGTLLSVIWYFRRELGSILQSFFVRLEQRNEQQKKDFFLGKLLLIGTIPAAVVGALWGDYWQQTFRSPVSIAITMSFWGLVLYAAQKYFEKMQAQKQTHSIEQLTIKQSLFIGCAQALSLIPGTSRSGICMTAALFSKLNKAEAAKFAFYLSVPITSVAVAHKMIDLAEKGIDYGLFIPLLVGFFTAFFSAMLTIRFLLSLIKKYSFTPFVWYRIVMSIAILIFFV